MTMKPAISNADMVAYFKTKKGKACAAVCQTIVEHLRRVFAGMIYRCGNPNGIGYKNYGGRGIKVLFASSDEFIDYVVNVLKVDPRGLTIDRINNDCNYERGNIRFVSQAENNRNRSKRH